MAPEPFGAKSPSPRAKIKILWTRELLELLCKCGGLLIIIKRPGGVPGTQRLAGTFKYSQNMKRDVHLRPGGVPETRGCTWEPGVYLRPGGIPGNRGCTWEPGVYLETGGVCKRLTRRTTNATSQTMRPEAALRETTR